MRLTLILCTLALLGRPLAAEDSLKGLDPTSSDPAKLQQALKAIGATLGEAQSKLDALEPEIDSVGGEAKKNRYGGASNPEISGNYGALFKDVSGYGLANRHGVALLLKLDMSILYHTDDGGSFAGDFGPVFSPGAYPDWIVDDTDEEHKGTGTASRAGTLLGAFKMTYHKGPLTGIGGFQSFQTSVLTLSGPLSNRPVLFDKNPYMINITSKAYYENQFLTGVPKRSAEESEHYIMGLRSDLDLPADLKLMTFIGDYEGFYDNDTVAHEYGGTLLWDHSDSIGTKLKLIGFNRSNDAGEILARGGPLNDRFFGLTNNTVFSLEGNQKIGPMATEFEAANAAYSDPSGLNGGIHVMGQAFRVQTDTPVGDSSIRAAAYSISPNYLVIDPVGKYNASGMNLLRYRDDPSNPDAIIPQTVVADPTLPMANTNTYSLGSQIRIGNTFLNLNLQNSQQKVASDARIWSSHFQGGGNLNDGTWFVNLNNNYQSWLPPSGTPAPGTYGTPGHYGSPGLEREFFWNPRRDPPSAGTSTTLQLNDYNQTYAPISWTPGSLGSIPDQGNRLYYNGYHQLETNMWRRNFEGIVNADQNSGLALSPSVKSISDASADLRMNIADYLPLGRALYWEVYSELLTVNDTSLLVPSNDPSNLFVQGIVDSTLIYNLQDDVVLLLNLGIENWTTDRMPTSFLNNLGVMQKGTLEYHDREAGVGADWNALPGKLNIYVRVKLLDHYDASSYRNNFQSRQMSWEMKTYF